MLQAYDTFKKPIVIGDTVVIGSFEQQMTTHTGDFYECLVIGIEKIENGPFGDILILDKNKYGRNLHDEVVLNKLGKYSHVDLDAVENEREEIQIFSNGVIKI